MSDLGNTLLFAQEDGAAISAIVIALWLLWLAVMVVLIVGLWKTFAKAGKPGWGAIVPIYNVILMLEIAQRPVWWIFLFLIPFVNVVVAIVMKMDIAKNFGKGVGFGLGLVFLGFIFYPILGFGDAKYTPAQLSQDSNK